MKKSIDTNVLLRSLVVDDSLQCEQACEIILGGDVFLPTTVLLEAEWVLRGVMQLESETVSRLIGMVLDMPGIELENPACVERALSALGSGMDFADALHLYSSSQCELLVTFDRKFAKRARKIGAIPPVKFSVSLNQEEPTA